ncbi:MAG: hypothetical protein IKR27_05010 [Lachnospiraceae bacterium]|nr:hypothetical protein [Lachnospiraceae bacterium]
MKMRKIILLLTLFIVLLFVIKSLLNNKGQNKKTVLDIPASDKVKITTIQTDAVKMTNIPTKISTTKPTDNSMVQVTNIPTTNVTKIPGLPVNTPTKQTTKKPIPTTKKLSPVPTTKLQNQVPTAKVPSPLPTKKLPSPTPTVKALSPSTILKPASKTPIITGCTHTNRKYVYKTVTVPAEGRWVDIPVYKDMFVCDCGKREDEFNDISEFYLHCFNNDENYRLDRIPVGFYTEWEETSPEYKYEKEVGWICPDCMEEKYYE